MALDKKLAEQPMEEDQNENEDYSGLNDEEKTDLRIAVAMGQNLLDQGGHEVIDTALKQSKDPGQVIGQFLFQMGEQLGENMPSGMELSPKIMLVPGGWLEQMSDYIQEEFGVKKQIMDKAEIYIASTAHQMAQSEQAQSGGAVGGVQAPPLPGPGAADPKLGVQ